MPMTALSLMISSSRLAKTWNITEVDAKGFYGWLYGPAELFNVFFYHDSGGLPGTNCYTAIGQSYANNSGVFEIPLSSPAVLGPGT